MKINEIAAQDGPTAYILVGLPGSGKSTWTNKMASKMDFVVVSSDDIIEKFAKEEGKTYSEVFDKYVGRATGMMKQAFREAVEQNRNIVWDQTNMSQKKRRGILQQLPSHYRKVAVVFNVDDRVLQDRLDKRARDTGKSIPDHIIKSMAQSYQEPTKAEGFDSVVFA